jgi:hypothetical protein
MMPVTSCGLTADIPTQPDHDETKERQDKYRVCERPPALKDHVKCEWFIDEIGKLGTDNKRN